MRFEFNEAAHEIVFSYGREHIPNTALTGLVTRCKISGDVAEGPVAGRAWCHPLDEIDLDKGEKMALKRALSRIDVKAFRRAAWRAYLQGRK